MGYSSKYYLPFLYTVPHPDLKRGNPAPGLIAFGCKYGADPQNEASWTVNGHVQKRGFIEELVLLLPTGGLPVSDELLRAAGVPSLDHLYEPEWLWPKLCVYLAQSFVRGENDE